MIEVLGTLRDDGLGGDARAHDNLWTIRTAIRGENSGRAFVRVSAAFRGRMLRSVSDAIVVDAGPAGTQASPAVRASASLGARAQKANSTLLDYEGFADSTALTTQYPGISFTHAKILQSGVSLNEFEFPPHSGSNVVSDSGGSMTITFSVPVASVSGFFTYSVPVTMTAFDAGNHQVAIANSHFTNNEALSGAVGSSPNDVIQVSAAGGITSVTIAGAANGSSFTMDDTVLGAPVNPNPNPNPNPTPPAPPPLTITTPPNLGSIGLGGALSTTLIAIGGSPPYHWSSLGPLPAGVTLGADGTLGGKPTVPGPNSFVATVTDQQGATVSATISFSVLAITTTSLPDATAFVAYSQVITATGGSLPYQFSATGVPPGFTFSSGGILSGSTGKQGAYTIVVQVIDGGGASVSASFAFKVDAPAPLAVPSSALPSGTTNIKYSQTLQATGGAPPYAWTVTTGTLPVGLTLGGNGVLSGFPTTTGTFAFTATATDSTGASASGNFSLVIALPALTITGPAALPSGMINSGYPTQFVTASGGMPSYTFSLGSGTLPPGIVLGADGSLSGMPTTVGTYSFAVKVSDSATGSATGNFHLTVRPASADLLLSAGGLSFSLVAGSFTLPPAQTLQIQSTAPAVLIPYSATLSPGAAWLTLSSAGGTTPGTVSVALTSQALSLAASSTPYTASIAIACTAANPCSANPQTVNVSLTVTAALPRLTVLTPFLAFTTSAGATQTMSQGLNIENSGGGTLGLTSIASAAAWVHIGSHPGSLGSGSATTINVTVDPTGLAAGYYRTAITVTTGVGAVDVPLTLLISASPTMTLAPGGQQILMSAGGVPFPGSNSFPVVVSGTQPVAWTASVVPGANWLTTLTPTGSSTSGTPGSAIFSIDPGIAAGLAAGTYYGTLRIASNQVVNSPQDFQVVLTVSSSASPGIPNPAPQGLVFVAPLGTTPSQNVRIFADGATSVAYQATASTTDGQPWLSVSPTTGTAVPGTPGQSTVSVNTAPLAQGIYYGSIAYAGAGAAVPTVSVTLVVTAAGGVSSSLRPALTPVSCTASQVAIARVQPLAGFSVSSGLPVPISVRLLNNCGGAVTNGQVAASFSNGDSQLGLQLANSSQGLYIGTWTPLAVSNQTTITLTASAAGLPSAAAQLTGSVSTGSAPVLNPHAVLHVFYPQVGAALSPGAVIQIYGSNLASAAAGATTVPLPLSLSGTSLTIGGIAAPLYYVSSGQINAQVPFELAPDRQYQVIVNANGALSTPQSIQLSAVAPGIAVNADGSVIAQHPDYSLVTAASPAKPGEILTIYASGLGATDNPVATGTAASSNPFSRTLVMPVVAINSEAASVSFAGLTPGAVGLYQVNFTVPQDAPNGSLSLSLTQNGVGANAATLNVHN